LVYRDVTAFLKELYWLRTRPNVEQLCAIAQPGQFYIFKWTSFITLNCVPQLFPFFSLFYTIWAMTLTRFVEAGHQVQPPLSGRTNIA
jgi:hypothetical protein